MREVIIFVSKIFVCVWIMPVIISNILILTCLWLSIYMILIEYWLNVKQGKEGVKWEFPRLVDRGETRQYWTGLHHQL